MYLQHSIDIFLLPGRTKSCLVCKHEEPMCMQYSLDIISVCFLGVLTDYPAQTGGRTADQYPSGPGQLQHLND